MVYGVAERRLGALLFRWRRSQDEEVQKVNGSLSSMPNVGPVLEDLLKRAGVGSPEALRAIGSREAWLRIRGIDPSACLHMLQALEGAVRGVGKKDLPESVKAGLREFFEERRKGGEGQRFGGGRGDSE